MTPLPRLLRHTLAFAAYIGRRLLSDNCKRSAAALTYMSLFAIVPLMTVTFATGSHLGRIRWTTA